MVDAKRSAAIKAGLAKAKAKGKKLGNPQNLAWVDRIHGFTVSGLVRGEKADARAESIRPIIEAFWKDRQPEFDPTTENAAEAILEAPKDKGQKERGVYRDLIKRLNTEGIPAPRGGTWGTETQVRRELLRLV